MDDRLRKRIEELVKEEISIVPYDSMWPKMFKAEVEFLEKKLPKNLVKRIEHFGSTAVPGISAKPVIDVLVEVASLEKTKKYIVPILEAEGYEYFWRPTQGEDQPPFYAWFIKRDSNGSRSHHLHMVERDSELWDRLYFRDYLIEFPDYAKQYEILKKQLSEKYPNDRVKYTEEKTEFIVSLTQKAKKHYCS
ncbi:GrpB family protein [bacterium]|nr:GrpB family protein [bacterium]